MSLSPQTLAGELMSHCECCMQLAADTHEADTIRQSIVVLMGTLAKHMDKENPKVVQLSLHHLGLLAGVRSQVVAENCTVK